MKRFVGVLVLAFAVVTAAVYADSLTINFESYSAGTVNGQDGWSKTGPYDVEVVVNSGAPASFATKSLRISNGFADGAFGGQAFSKSLVNEAGETAASNNGLSGGTRQPHFDMSVDIISKIPGAQQPGLLFSMSPDRGDGARMSYLRVEDGVAGLNVYFVDVQGTFPCVSITGQCGNFQETIVASALDRTVPHKLGLSINFSDGPGNDVVNVLVDGVVVHTGTTWEDYYAYDAESADGFPSRTVDSVAFLARGTSVPLNLGNGFLLDNLSLNSGPIPVIVPTAASQCKKGGYVTFGTVNQGQCVSFVNKNK